MRAPAVSALVAALLLSACSMTPRYVRPAPPVPDAWPQGAGLPATQAAAPGLPWRSMIADPRLQQVIGRMLANNRDLRAAVANVAVARAQYRASRAGLFPTVAATGAGSMVGGNRGSAGTDSYSAQIGISSFELDLFGRLRDQARAGFETYLATATGALSTRLSLVQETGLAWVTLGADRDLLAIARDTASSARRTVELNQSLLASGLGNAADVESARTVLAQAESDVAGLVTQVDQDRNALNLLVGAPVEEALLPTTLAGLEEQIATPPAGLSSSVLLARPDVVQAEHALKSANYSVGAARAAFFPAINLTTALGFASGSLADLFKSGSSGWSVAPSASLPLVGGARFANLDAARANRDYYAALYEKAVQGAFRDVADALARRATIAAQIAAQDRLVGASRASLALSEERWRVGSLAYLGVLTAQRTLYTARQTQVAAQLADYANGLALYAAVGADASLAEPPPPR